MSDFVALAAAEVELFFRKPLVKDIVLALHYILLLLAVVDHWIVSGTTAVHNIVTAIVVFGIFRGFLVDVENTVLVMGVVAAATVQTAMHVLLVDFVNKLPLLNLKVIYYRLVLQPQSRTQGLVVGLVNVASFQQKHKQVPDEKDS